MEGVTVHRILDLGIRVEWSWLLIDLFTTEIGVES